ncbi:permease-like cell division protein FtsX [Oscillospiraceae bacterium LTW-04]|nr:permease-like cell division protein FtsX [Oscillospiraceae bacterium MB24-C1]
MPTVIWEANVRGSSFRYLIKEGFRNIYQNRAISIAAIGVLMACLLLVGISMLFTINVNNMVGYFESQNEIMVFLSDDVVGDELTDIDSEIRSISNVASVTFISREDGLKSWMEELGDDGTLLEWLIEDNPLQNAYRLVVKDLSKMQETIELVGYIDGIDTISASNEVAQAVTGLKQAVSVGGLAVIALLVAVSLSIVSNTIKLTVFNRRKEISIMKYVGATDAFIRLPFLSEGMLLGFISATLAFFMLWGGYIAFGHWVSRSTFYWASLVVGQLVAFKTVALKLYLYFLAAGVGIGALGSVFFVGKYIKV